MTDGYTFLDGWPEARLMVPDGLGVSLVWVDGSNAHHLADEDSDLDIRMTAMPDRTGLLTQVEHPTLRHPEDDVVLYGVNHLFRMMRAGNPNLLTLADPPGDCIQYSDPWGDMILRIAPRLILSTNLIRPLRGYAYGQHRGAARETGRKRDKMRMRSLWAWRVGRELCETGEPHVRRDTDRSELLAIRHGDYDPDGYERTWERDRIAFEIAAANPRLAQPLSDPEYHGLILPILEEWTRTLVVPARA